MTRSEIITAVQEYTSRTDVDYTSVMANAQAVLNRLVRLREQQEFTVLDVNSLDTEAPDGNNRFILPDDYLAFDFLVDPALNTGRFSFQPPAAFFASRSARGAFPRPAGLYTIYGSFIYLSTPPDNEAGFLFGYYKKLAQLIMDIDTNLLARDHPDIYIDAASVEVYKILQDDMLQAKHQGNLDAKLEVLNTTEQRASFNWRDMTASPPGRQVV